MAPLARGALTAGVHSDASPECNFVMSCLTCIHKKVGASFLETSTVTQRHGAMKKQTEKER